MGSQEARCGAPAAVLPPPGRRHRASPPCARQAPFCCLRKGCHFRALHGWYSLFSVRPRASWLPLSCLRQGSTVQQPFYYLRLGRLPPGRHCPAVGRVAPRSSHFTTSGKGGCLLSGQHLTAATILPQAGWVPPGRHSPSSDRGAPHSVHFATSGKSNCLWGAIAQPSPGQGTRVGTPTTGSILELIKQQESQTFCVLPKKESPPNISSSPT